MPEYRIEIDRENCVGDGLCCEKAPATFDMDDEDKAVVTNPTGDPTEDILCAAKECLTDAISLYDARTGQRIWPRD